MPTKNESGLLIANEGGQDQVAVTKKKKDQVNAILARTNWRKYWEEVESRVEMEVEAYDLARARSLTTASRRFLR